MSDLPVNYLDDILAESMGGKRKFKITHANGSTEEVTIEDISEYAQIGSRFGAGDINKTNQAVNEKFDSGDVVDPMLTTEPGFAADAYKTKLQFDEQNKKIVAPINNLTSTSTTAPLSANQGRVLNEKIVALNIPFIDTSSVLYTQNAANFSYTATQDCVVVGTIETSGTNASTIWVNNVRVGGTYSAAKDVTSSVFIPLKKGQTFKAECGKFNSTYPLRIFALL